MASQGILYFAIGQEYIQEACRSAASVKAHSPHLSITVAADTVFTSTDVDQVVPINSFEWSKLIGAL
ncbi:MAG: hypothetical protein SFW36_11970, partial [Leptolyngbyaceae cyanobacterium bins.59]|nr:hypothetical protein [Leptolyngbyaceae cyanobacterium bins.59]